jgi:hypothetical protein
MALLKNESYERIEELPEERRREKDQRKLEDLAVHQPESPFFKMATAWAVISNLDI